VAQEPVRFRVQLQAATVQFFLLSLQMAAAAGQVQEPLVCQVVPVAAVVMEAQMLVVLEILRQHHQVKEAPEVLELERLLKRLEVVVAQIKQGLTQLH
jgi:hypothetical protein